MGLGVEDQWFSEIFFTHAGWQIRPKGLYLPSENENVSVAQLVEQLTLNQRVDGSNPSGDTKPSDESRSVFLFCSGKSLLFGAEKQESRRPR